MIDFHSNKPCLQNMYQWSTTNVPLEMISEYMSPYIIRPITQRENKCVSHAMHAIDPAANRDYNNFSV